MNRLTKFKEHINDNTTINNTQYFIINIFISYFATILVFILGQLLVIPAILLWVLELVFRKVSFKRKVNLDKVMLSWESKLLINIKYNLKLENRYNNIDRIQKDFTLYPLMSLEEFIMNFLRSYNDNYETWCVRQGGGLDFICFSSKRRSLGDIFLICRSYYPKCSIIDVLKILIDLIDRKVISGSRCGTINKFVFYNQKGNSVLEGKVEYGCELTFKEIIEHYKTKQ